MAKRIYNFAAGPCTLPLSALEEARDEFVDYHGTGMSLIEMSHRGKEYDAVHVECLALLRELLSVPEDVKIMLLGGGATLQFGMLPMNLIPEGQGADYVITGAWAKKALSDAKLISDKVAVAWDGEAHKYTRLPKQSELRLRDDAAYVHLCANETIGGIEFRAWPTAKVPLVVDMSSDILSRRFDWQPLGAVYAGAQKNMGPAGVTVVMVRESLLADRPKLPAYLRYKLHASKDSLYNTPPVFSIYMMGKTLKWVKAEGGLAAMERNAEQRAAYVYDQIKASGGYYRSPVEQDDRSNMNVVWRLPTEDLEKKFIAEATAAGFSGLKGHRDVGGCRASMYNAMPMAGARDLAQFMADFQGKNRA